VGKIPSELVKHWVLRHDNVPCQTALAVQRILVKNQTAANLQLPYPPDLTPCNFCHFSRPKTGLKDHHFTSAEKFNRILQHVTDPYQKKTSRGTSSNGTMLEQAVRAEESRFQGE